MKRDFDLIRKILLEIESCDDPQGMGDSRGIRTREHSTKCIQQHVGLLVDAGFVAGKHLKTINSPVGFYLQVNLAWRGHEFLDNARDDSIWQTVKKELGSKWSSVSFGVLETLLKQAVLKISGML